MRAAALVVILLLSLPYAVAQDAPPTHRIEQMKDNVYRFTYGHYRSVFMVTAKGIIVTDPISTQAATVLQHELKQRFNVPVRYMIYSHNHVDHVMGGEVFDSEKVTVVSHRYAKEDIVMTKLPTARPELTFDNTLTLTLGDSAVELTYYGPNNGHGNIGMRFMPANVMYIVDWVVLGRMPYKSLPGYDIQGMIRSTRALLAEPGFDLLVGGHADAGNRAQVMHYLSYLEALYAAVRDGMLNGESLDSLKQSVVLDDYQNLRMYKEWLPLNIEGVHRTLTDMSYFEMRPDVTAQ